MNSIWINDSKRARALMMSALYNHAIDPLTFKCLPCTHDGCSRTSCVKYHNAGEKRNKNIVEYRSCPRRCLEPDCKRADACKRTHTTNDVIFHHSNFLSKICHNISATGECQFSTPCSFAHPGTPDMFYRPEWEDLYVAGLEKSFLFLAGAIRNLKKIKSKARRNVIQYHVVFIASNNGVADAAHSFIKELVGTHIHVVINRTGKFQIGAGRGGILICTLPRLFELAVNHSVNFTESYSLIFDDVSALLSVSQAPLLRKFLSMLPTLVRNPERMNKVVVCSKVNQFEVLQMENLLSTKFTVKSSIPNVEKYFVPIPATVDSTSSRVSVRKNVSAYAAAARQQQPNSSSLSDAISRAAAAATKPQHVKASSRWDVQTAAIKQHKTKAPPRWDSMASQPPVSTRNPSVQNFAVKSAPVIGSSIVEVIAQARADRSSSQTRGSSSNNASHKDAGPPERLNYNRIQTRPDEWSRNSDNMDAGAGQRHDDHSRNQKGNNDWNRNSGDWNIGARQRQDNSDRKRNRGDDRSGNFGDRDIGERPRHDGNNRKRKRGNDRSGNSGNRDAGPDQRNNDFNRKQRKDNDWVENSDGMNSRNMLRKQNVNRGRPQTMQHHDMHPVSYNSGENVHQQNSMQVPSNSYGQSGETNDSRASRSNYSPANYVQARPGIPVQNFSTPAVIRLDQNQFGTSRQERENSFMGHDQRHFPLQGPKQMYSPSIERPANEFQGSRRSQADYSLQGSRPDQRDNRSIHDARNTVQASANSGAPKFSNMDEKLQAVLAPASAVESVGPAVEAIVTAARQLGSNSREALALFADKDHATILSVYFNTLEERAANLAGTDQFLIYQRAVAFGRAILDMAKRDTMK